MPYFLTISLKVLSWAFLLGSTVVFFVSVASARISAVLGGVAFVMGFVAFVILLALGILLERSGPSGRAAPVESPVRGDLEDAAA
jgi:hypothetical protein